MAELIFLDIYGKCSLPICTCDTVALCMTSTWNTRTTNGLGIAFGKVFSIGKFATPSLPYTNQSFCGCPTVTYDSSCVPTYTQSVVPTCNPCLPQTTQTVCTNTSTACPMCVFKIQIDTAQFEIDPETGVEYVPICSDIVDISPYSCIYEKIIASLTPA